MTISIEIDPKGSWRRQRFEFCNALEDAMDESASADRRAKAWAELEKMGVRRVEEDANGVPRSSVLPGQNGSEL